VKPEELLYAESHEWVHLSQQDGQSVATVGISAFALEQLTDLVFMELPQVGASLKAGDVFGEVESVKAVSSLFSPVTGDVKEVNTGIVDRLESLADLPYDQAWIVKIRVTEDATIAKLLDFTAYQAQCATEG